MSSAPGDQPSLTDEQREAVEQFTAVTDQTAAIAIPLLEKCQWNTQIAVTRFFDGDGDIIDPSAEPSFQPSTSPPPRAAAAPRWDNLMDSMHMEAASRPGHDAFRRHIYHPAPPIASNSDRRSTSAVLGLALFPFSLAYTILKGIFGAIAWAFPSLPRLLSRIWPSPQTTRPARNTATPTSNSVSDANARFIADFRQEFGPTADLLKLQATSYNAARDQAKRELKYLLVILLDSSKDANATFVRGTLLAPEVIDFLRDNSTKVLLWASDSAHDAEADRVAASLGVAGSKIPFAGLVVHTPSISSSAMSLILRLSGPRPASAFVERLAATIERHDRQLVPVRLEKREQQAARSIRNEQNDAYERSLAADRERDRKRRESAARAEKAALDEERSRRDLALMEENRAQWRRWRAGRLLKEPESRSGPGTGIAPEISRVSIRLPTGERIVRKFAYDTSMEELYAFVECHDLLDATCGDQETDVPTRPSGYEHDYAFKLVSPMPRQVYDIHSGDEDGEKDGREQTVGQCVGRSGNLIAERNDMDDDSE